MFIIRRARSEDVPTLLKLSRMVHFINLPPDKDILDRKVAWSRQSFMLAHETDFETTAPKRGKSKAQPDHRGVLAGGMRSLSGQSPLFMFVMEETDEHGKTGGAIGTSQIIARMGGPGEPNLSLQLERKHLFSQSLQLGVTHTVAKLHLDETGPTEIGGLIMQPSYRGHRLKLGRLISLVRFHYMGLHRHFFADRVLAELMGPITIDGHNPFWDYCTRSFINMTYDEADKFCQETREFILTLFPREEIYLTLIPPQARTVVGQVGHETLPAKKMLEQLGFKYHNRVDPFDGGPHLEAPLDSISIVKATRRATLGEAVEPGTALREHGIVSVVDADGEFRAAETAFQTDKQNRLIIPRDVLDALNGESGMEAGVTPLGKPERTIASPTVNGAAKTKTKTKTKTKKKSKR